MTATSRGAFIVIEGLDRSGKSTQAAILQSRLQGPEQSTTKAVLIKFPDRTTTIGKMIDAYLRSQSEFDDHAIHLLFSANRWELASTIYAHLAAGTTVIADRYAFSGIAFSARKGLSYDWCRAPDIGLPAPDLTLFLNVEPGVARTRGGYGEERYETEDVQRSVRVVFERIGEEMKTDGQGQWVEIDASREKDLVARNIWRVVEPLSRGVASSLRKLWERDLTT
ncbi:thymidylate kinase [Pisolithus tinctorius]|uniref:Thymidylate kinase n=1 Tax=Pisolithus tinctorius Marx 270 TaxID=870435 RepID=A0A0C3NI95_PISTI|nr:thymidylate kinase [Pisolithus tinctorius]KIN95405.1 hypothetical protein M404DRAFT_166086 [Pisolithus tinctorius Marx 270]